MPSGSLNLLPGKAEIIIHPPIDINAFATKDMTELIAKTRGIIASGVK
jgi:hypothetical protein